MPGYRPNKLDNRLYDFKNPQIAKRMEDPIERERYRMKEVRKLHAGDKPWSFSTVQTCALPDMNKGVLGKTWYDRRIGVRVRMLGESGTAAFAGRSPESRGVPGREPNKGDKSTLPNEVGGVTLMVERTMPATTFVAGSSSRTRESLSPSLASPGRTSTTSSITVIGIRWISR